MSRVSFLVGASTVDDSNCEGAFDLQSEDSISKTLPTKNFEFWSKVRGNLIERQLEDDMRATAPATLGQKMKYGVVALKVKRKLARARQRRWRQLRLPLIKPQSGHKILWDIFVGGLILYSVLMIPLQIAFLEEALFPSPMFWIDALVDLCFGVDIALTFVTAYMDDDRMECSYKKIAKRYFKTWFTIDFFSTFPSDRIVPLILVGIDGAGKSAVRSIKLIKILRMFRLLKLLRLARLKRKFEHLELARHVSPSVQRLVLLLGYILFVAHLISCMWFVTNECATAADCAGDAACLAEQTWDTCGDVDSLASQYLAAFYWTIATMMAVGYGDIAADTLGERVYAIATEVVGATAFGFIIATVAVIVEAMDPAATAKRARLDEVREYLAERRLPRELQRRVRRHFEYYYSKVSVFQEAALLRGLPAALRARLMREGFRELVRQLRFFDGLGVLLTTDLVFRLKPMRMDFKAHLGNLNAVSEEVYIVLKGKIHALARHRNQTGAVLIGVYTDGAHFELASYVYKKRMEARYHAAAVTDLMWLDHEDLAQALARHNAHHLVKRQAAAHEARLREVLALPTVDIGDVYAKERVLWNDRVVDVAQHLEAERLGLVGDEAHRFAVTGGGGAAAAAAEASLGASARRPGSAVSHRSDGPSDDDEGSLLRGGGGGGGGGGGALSARGLGGGGAGAARLLRTLRVDWVEEEEPPEETGRRAAPDGGGGGGGGGGKGPAGPRRVLQYTETEETSAELLRRGILDPTHPSKLRWDMFLAVLIVMSVLVIPLRIGFDVSDTAAWTAVDWAVDAFFFLDMAANFRTAFEDEFSVYVTVPRFIRDHYLKSWFLIDFFSTVPFDRLFEPVMGGTANLKALRLTRSLRLVRLLKLFRIFKLKKLGNAEDLVEVNAVVVRALKLLLTLGFVGHLFGCFWSYVAIEAAENWEEGEDAAAWWQVLGIESSDLYSRYVAALYWAFTTMTTVGYGDVLPVSDLERVYATVIMIMGATVFGYIVGSVSTLATNPFGASARQQDKLLKVHHYLDEQKIQTKLRSSVKKHVEYHLSQRSPFDERRLLAQLPADLRRACVLQAHSEVRGKISLFKLQENYFVAFMLQRMQPEFVLQDVFINTPEEGSDGIYFLTSGIAEEVKKEKSGELTVQKCVSEGQVFGYDGFMGMETENIGYRAFTDCTLYVLMESDISSIIQNQPIMARKLQRALKNCIVSQSANLVDGLATGNNKAPTAQPHLSGWGAAVGKGKVARASHSSQVYPANLGDEEAKGGVAQVDAFFPEQPAGGDPQGSGGLSGRSRPESDSSDASPVTAGGGGGGGGGKGAAAAAGLGPFGAGARRQGEEGGAAAAAGAGGAKPPRGGGGGGAGGQGLLSGEGPTGAATAVAAALVGGAGHDRPPSREDSVRSEASEGRPLLHQHGGAGDLPPRSSSRRQRRPS